jgi:hypothetical protein
VAEDLLDRPHVDACSAMSIDHRVPGHTGRQPALALGPTPRSRPADRVMDASVGERLLDAAFDLSSGSTGAARSDCNIDRLCSGPYDVLSGWSAC